MLGEGAEHGMTIGQVPHALVRRVGRVVEPEPHLPPLGPVALGGLVQRGARGAECLVVERAGDDGDADFGEVAVSRVDVVGRSGRGERRRHAGSGAVATSRAHG